MTRFSSFTLPYRLRREWLRKSFLTPAAVALGLALPMVGLQAKQLPSPVITVSQLQPLLQAKSVKVLDIRELVQPDQKTPIYAAGHIPGALPAQTGFKSRF